MAWWESFEQLEFSNEILIVLGALLFIIGVMKIIRSGLKMFFWVVLCGIGVGSVAYGTNGEVPSFLSGGKGEISEAVGAGKELSTDALKLLCTKLDKS